MGRKGTFNELSRAEKAALVARLRVAVDAFGSLDAAAKAVGVSVRQISHYLAGKNLPSFPTLTKLAAASGRSLDWILTGVGPEPTGEPHWATVDDEELRESQQASADAYVRAGEATTAGPRMLEAVTYLNTGLGPRLRARYSEKGITLSPAELDSVLRLALRLLTEGDGVLSRPLPVEHWPTVVEAIENSHRDALILSSPARRAIHSKR